MTRPPPIMDGRPVSVTYSILNRVGGISQRPELWEPGSSRVLLLAMHRLWRAPELLGRVLSCLSKRDLIACALVQRSWKEPALDTVWHSVEDLAQLLRVLAPLEKSNSVYRFTRSLDILDWMRFHKMAHRIRILRCRHVNVPCGTFHSDIFKDIGLVRTTEDVLPNLHTLEWGLELQFFPLFLHPRIHTLRLWISPAHIVQTSTAAQSLCTNITLRSPNIKTLDIGSVVPAVFIESELIQLFNSLQLLERVILPPHYTTSPMIASLATHPSLLHLSTSGLGTLPPRNGSFSIELPQGAFNRLLSLDLSANFDNTIEIIRSLHGFHRLTILHLSSHRCEVATSMRELLRRSADSFPHLESFFVSPYVGCLNDPISCLETLSSSALRPLLNLSKLSSLKIYHQLPFSLTVGNLSEFSRSLPLIEICLLNYAPYTFKPACTPGLEALIPFAEHCLHLRHLGLHLNATSSLQNHSNIPTFRRLESLQLGNSPIDDPVQPALFLAHILPPYCEILNDVLWQNLDWRTDNRAKKSRHIIDQWTKSKDLVRVFVQWKAEAEQRVVARFQGAAMSSGVIRSQYGDSSSTPSTSVPQGPPAHPTEGPLLTTVPASQSFVQPAPPPEPLNAVSVSMTPTPSSSGSIPRRSPPQIVGSPTMVTPAGSENLDNTSQEPIAAKSKAIRPGDIVHASIPELPLWPGIAVNAELVPAQVQLKRPAPSPSSEHPICVRLFPEGQYVWLTTQNLSTLKKDEILLGLARSPQDRMLYDAYEAAANPREWLNNLPMGVSMNLPLPSSERPRAPVASTPTRPTITDCLNASTSAPVAGTELSTSQPVSDCVTVRAKKPKTKPRQRPASKSAKKAPASTSSGAAETGTSFSASETASTSTSKRLSAKLDSWRSQLVDIFLGSHPLTEKALSRASSTISKLESHQNDIPLHCLEASNMIPIIRQIISLPNSDGDRHHIRERVFNLVEGWYVRFSDLREGSKEVNEGRNGVRIKVEEREH